MNDRDYERWIGYLHELARYCEADRSIAALPDPRELRGAPTIVLRREVLVRVRMQTMLLTEVVSELTGIPATEVTPGALVEYMAKLQYEKRKKARESDGEQERAAAQGEPRDRAAGGGGDAGGEGHGRGGGPPG